MARAKKPQAERVPVETDFKPIVITVSDEDLGEWDVGDPVRFSQITEPATIADAPNVFTNTTTGTTIHLGDGRKLAPGESAEVSPDLMALLRGEG